MSPADRRTAVRWAQDAFGVGERRASRALVVERTMVRYRSRAADDRPVRARLRELAQARLIPSAADWRVIGNAWVRVDHRWAFSQLTLLSARSKEGLSSVISPILACGAVGEREAHDL